MIKIQHARYCSLKYFENLVFVRTRYTAKYGPNDTGLQYNCIILQRHAFLDGKNALLLT